MLKSWCYQIMVQHRISHPDPDPGTDLKFWTDLDPDPVFSTAESGPRFFLLRIGSGSCQFLAGSTTMNSEVYANIVLILYGNLEHVAHAWRKIDLFEEKYIRFATALDLIKFLIQIKYQRLILTCAPISELPFNISTMRVNMSTENAAKHGINRALKITLK